MDPLTGGGVVSELGLRYVTHAGRVQSVFSSFALRVFLNSRCKGHSGGGFSNAQATVHRNVFC